MWLVELRIKFNVQLTQFINILYTAELNHKSVPQHTAVVFVTSRCRVALWTM